MIYYVIIGRLVSETEWKQEYIVPFGDQEKANEYKEYFLSAHKSYQAIITESNIHIMRFSDWV